MFNLLGYVAAIGLSCLQTGFAILGNTPSGPIFIAKFGWSQKEADLYNSILSVAGAFGIAIGALAGGKLISYGRRRSIILLNFVLWVGLSLM